MQEQNRFGVEEDRIDVFVRTWRALRTGGHFEGTQEARDEYLRKKFNIKC